MNNWFVVIQATVTIQLVLSGTRDVIWLLETCGELNCGERGMIKLRKYTDICGFIRQPDLVGGWDRCDDGFYSNTERRKTFWEISHEFNFLGPVTVLAAKFHPR
jgi:hypothetical protein